MDPRSQSPVVCLLALLAIGSPLSGSEVIEDGMTPADVTASALHALGIPHRKEYHTPTGRPVMIVREGEVVEKLFA